MIRKFAYWLPAILWMSGIFYKSNQPDSGFSETTANNGHYFIYGILAIFVIFALSRTTELSWLNVVILGIIISILYGISDEFHQSLIPGRDADIFDLLRDIVGIVIVSILIQERNLRRFAFKR